MAARARIHATLVIAAALAATVASAEDRRLNIINEGMAPGTWQPVAETMAVPAYPGVVADKSEDVCVSIGYMIDDEGSTSDFAVLDAWGSQAEGLKPIDDHFLPYSQNALAAVQRWRYQSDGETRAHRRRVYTAATFAFSTTGADVEALKARCRIADLKGFINKMRTEALKRNIDRGRSEVSAPLAPPKNT